MNTDLNIYANETPNQRYDRLAVPYIISERNKEIKTLAFCALALVAGSITALTCGVKFGEEHEVQSMPLGTRELGIFFGAVYLTLSFIPLALIERNIYQAPYPQTLLMPERIRQINKDLMSGLDLVTKNTPLGSLSDLVGAGIVNQANGSKIYNFIKRRERLSDTEQEAISTVRREWQTFTKSELEKDLVDPDQIKPNGLV